MSDHEHAFSLEAVPGPDACLILARGELDLDGCPDLDRAIRDAEQTQAHRIILDLEDLTFIDSAGLRTLFDASRRSAANGNRLQMTPGKGHVAGMFRLTEADKGLPLIGPLPVTRTRPQSVPSYSGSR